MTAGAGVCPSCGRRGNLYDGVMAPHQMPYRHEQQCRGTGLPPVPSEIALRTGLASVGSRRADAAHRLPTDDPDTITPGMLDRDDLGRAVVSVYLDLRATVRTHAGDRLADALDQLAAAHGHPVEGVEL